MPESEAPTPARARDERGGAVSLWVLLMVPVSAFAAVVAMAGPQRLAAESTMQEAADDLAAFTVAWRDGQQDPDGPLPGFPPECTIRSEQQRAHMTTLEQSINNLVDPTHLDFATELSRLNTELDNLFSGFSIVQSTLHAADKAGLQDRLDALSDRLDDWDEACELLFKALVRDLGYLGLDMNALRGSYSDSLKESTLWGWGTCSDPGYTTESACTNAGEAWTVGPCRASGKTVVRDAVHVALAAQWQDAGWAAAQVWPDGLPMAAESMGRLTQRDLTNPPPCGDQLVVLDEQGRPVWAGNTPQPLSRELAQSVRRSALAG